MITIASEYSKHQRTYGALVEQMVANHRGCLHDAAHRISFLSSVQSVDGFDPKVDERSVLVGAWMSYLACFMPEEHDSDDDDMIAESILSLWDITIELSFLLSSTCVC